MGRFARRASLLWVLTFGLALIAGSAFNSVGASDATLVVQTMPHAGNPTWLNHSVEVFKRRRPDVTIQVVPGAEEQLIVMIAGGTPPDIVHGTSTQLPNWVGRGLLEDLEPYAQRDPSFDRSEYLQGVIDSLTYQDRLYAMPRAWSAVALLYNIDLFEERGVAYPDESWTWDDLVQAGKQLTWDRSGDGRIDTFGFSDIFAHHHRYPIWVWGAGGSFWNESLTRTTINEPAAVAGLEFWMDLYLTHQIGPRIIGGRVANEGVSTVRTGHGASNELFENGQIAMFNSTRFVAPAGTFTVGVAPLAKGPAGRTSVMVTDFFGIYPESQNKELAWEFIKFLAEEEGNAAGRGIGDPSPYWYALPPLRDHAARMLEESDEIGWQYWITVAMDARRGPTVHPVMNVAGSFNREFEAVMAGQQSVRDATTRLEREWNAIIQEALANGERW